jgi:hypothetical protein
LLHSKFDLFGSECNCSRPRCFGEETVGLFSEVVVKWEHGWELGIVEKMVRLFPKKGRGKKGCRAAGIHATSRV